MRDVVILAALTWATGLAMVGGALIALVEHISNRWLETELRHTIIAFGGGILIAAVALVLVPEGMDNLPPLVCVLCFAAGGVSVMGLDRLLNRLHEKGAQLAAMLLDFIPEVLALGSLYLLEPRMAILLAFLIVFQNLPEGFNACLELKAKTEHKQRAVLGAFFAMSLLGPILGLSGYFFLSESPEIISGVMIFASGGILYLIFQDIAPMAKIRHRWAPALGSVAGFLFGMVGKMVILHM